jgi:hypothetical protein
MTSFSQVPIRAVLVLTLLCARLASATEYSVKLDGSGQFTTIQACANAARAGDTCVVYPGTYSERVETSAGGTSATNRIVFRAQGAVTMRGFAIRNPYITVEGFQVTGYSQAFDGLITIHPGGNHCEILNNTLRDGATNVMGLHFNTTAAGAASNCVVRGNTLRNLNYHFITTSGSNHLFVSNVLEVQNTWDFVRLFGTNHIFRRNIFRHTGSTANTGNHPDFSQTFGSVHASSENHLFEENFIGDIDAQFGQYDSGGVLSGREIFANYRNVTFRRNIIVNVSMNGNFAWPGVRFENNTFYRFAHTLSGLFFGGTVTRGVATGALLKNNVFLASGTNDSSGFYTLSGASLTREVVGVFVTNDPPQTQAVTANVYQNLQTHGYITGNGVLLPAAYALTDISQFKLDAAYATYKAAMYQRLVQTVQLDQTMRKTFAADHNYVAGAAAAGYPPKRNSGCASLGTPVDFNFCEAHGINGGNPGLKNVLSPLGPDGVPFTLDDGLKPLSTSRLCKAGEGGVDIGAYSCDSNLVFPGSTPPPKPPTNFRINPPD